MKIKSLTHSMEPLWNLLLKLHLLPFFEKPISPFLKKSFIKKTQESKGKPFVKKISYGGTNTLEHWNVIHKARIPAKTLYNISQTIFNPFSPRKIEKTIYENPIIPQTLNIKACQMLKLIKCSLKNVWVKAIFFSPVLRYCCLKVCQYYDLHSRLKRAKGLKFQWKTKKMFGVFFGIAWIVIFLQT